MVVFRTRYDIYRDRTDVSFTDYFYNLDQVAKLDMIQDAINDLTRQYNLILSSHKKVSKNNTSKT